MLDEGCKRRFQATIAPLMPLPIMTVSVVEGRVGALRWFASDESGLCQ
jgi:hypothetical protein